MTYFRVLIKRGDLIESSHEAKCLVKNSNFKILLSTNNDKDLVYPRSSIKIFQALPLIISDAHVGLKKARQAVFPSIVWQRCQFHLQQNAHAYITKKSNTS